tara:strand:+ start:473 stop:952 length:480 start_codon:yes stop_codon:yes gene_type:complete
VRNEGIKTIIMKLENTAIKLTADQQILLYSFLTDTKNEGAPNNFEEWGLEWTLICHLAENIPNIIVRGFLTIDVDSYFAVFNWLASYIGEIKSEKKGEDKFKDFSSLFIHLKESYELTEPKGSKYSPYIYIPKFYVDKKPLKKIYIDPNSSVEDVLKNQ